MKFSTILGIGAPSGKTEPQLGMPVLKAGRTTGVTKGVVTALAVETWISWSIQDPSMRYRFVDLIRIDGETAGVPFALPGDSGALVVAESSLAAVALYSAGTDQGHYGLASPISTVEKCLDVQIQSAAPA